MSWRKRGAWQHQQRPRESSSSTHWPEKAQEKSSQGKTWRKTLVSESAILLTDWMSMQHSLCGQSSCSRDSHLGEVRLQPAPGTWREVSARAPCTRGSHNTWDKLPSRGAFLYLCWRYWKPAQLAWTWAFKEPLNSHNSARWLLCKSPGAQPGKWMGIHPLRIICPPSLRSWLSTAGIIVQSILLILANWVWL